MFAPPERPPEVVDFPKNILGGGYLPWLTKTLDPPWPTESPDPSWLPESMDLPWLPGYPASVLETIYALSVSCVSVSPRSQSLPGVSSPDLEGTCSFVEVSCLVCSALVGSGLVWKPLLGGGGSVTNHLDTDSPPEVVYTTTLLLHITHGLHFPSTIALITHLSPITHYTAGSDHTLYKSLGLPLSHC